MVDSAEFNEPIDEKEFALAAEAGSHVFIYYKNDQVTQPRFVSLTSEVPDLVAFLLEKGNLNNDVELGAKDKTVTAADRGIDLVVMKAAAKNNLNNGGLPEELGQTLSQVQGVKQVVGGLVDTLTFRDANLKSVLININGWPAHCPWLERLKVQFGGRSLIAGNERKAIVGKDLAAKLEKQVGDKIELYGDEQFEIVGIYESPIQLENNGLVVPLGELQRLMNLPGKVTGFSIAAEHPIDAKGLEQLRQRVAAVQPGLEVTVVQTPVDQPTSKDNESPKGADTQPPANGRENNTGSSAVPQPGKSGEEKPGEPVTFTGKVIDVDGKPVARQRIMANAFVNPPPYQSRWRGGVLTYNDGEFVDPADYPVDMMMFTVRTLDDQCGIARVETPPKKTTIQLKRSASVHGQVLDQDGKPIGGAQKSWHRSHRRRTVLPG